MLRLCFLSIFALLCTTSLPSTFASPAQATAPIAIHQGFTPQWNGPLLFSVHLHPDINATTLQAQTYQIPDSDLYLVIDAQRRYLGMKDTLMLLFEALYSSTARIHEGGEKAEEPVEVFVHKRGWVQMQVVGYRDRLTPWKIAQLLAAMETLGGKGGFYEATVLLMQHKVGAVAKLHIR
ncbi:MAG: hypothetical protein L6R40_004254 [Gallowayella cf. fulva]|nr:MAG: hypothetical protein L6R40_004254 [Xanthomendoza cf. fulva]